MKPTEFLNELSNDTLASYKKKAGADATAADKEGDTKKADKRFSGIVKATKKQFANDEKKEVAEGTQRVDSLVTDALKLMRGAEVSDAVNALKTVLGDREYNGRRGHYNFYVKQMLDMYGQQGVAEGEENKYGSQENWDSLRKDIRSQYPYKKGTTVTVPHKGKLVNGKIVRYEAGGGGYSPAYVVDIGEYESIMVEPNKVRQGVAEEEDKMDSRYSKTEWMPLMDAIKILKHYGATPEEYMGHDMFPYYDIEGNRKYLEDITWNADNSKNVRVSLVNQAVRELKAQKQGVAKGLNEFAPVGGDDREPDEEEILRQLAAKWWLGTEQEMSKAQKTLTAMGWDIGQDESGDDDAGVFVIRVGDENGDSYIAFNHSELEELNEAFNNYHANRTGFSRGQRDDERHDLDTPTQVWGLKINGKVWSKDGKDVTFASKEAAMNIRNAILKNKPDLEIGLVTKGGVAEEKQRLDPSCWKGYKKQGTKMKGDTRVNNCVPVKESSIMQGLKKI